MKIGLALDNRRQERRVALRPQEVAELAVKNQILVEHDAGLGAGFSDEDYRRAGALPTTKKQVYSCPLVVKLREPNRAELALMRPGSTIFSMLHLINRPSLEKMLKEYRINAISMERIKDHLGERTIEDLHEVGYAGMMKGFELWGGNPEKAVVKIMGYGKIGIGAIQAASRCRARVIALNMRQMNNMEKHLPDTDILVDALTWPASMRGKVYLIKREMLRLLPQGAVLLGLVSNPAWKYPIETMRPTSLDDISYKFKGVTHAACWGWSGLDAENVTRRYSLQITPMLADIAHHGLKHLPKYLKDAYLEVQS